MVSTFGVADLGTDAAGDHYDSKMVLDQVRSGFEEPNSFVGRERELGELRQFARSMRAVTLCGALRGVKGLEYGPVARTPDDELWKHGEH